ncbi:MAG: Gfo/Idh/MocA family oxidoreductase [Gemmatimonadaceae bacterium]
MTGRKVAWGVLSTAKIGRNAVNPAIQRSRNGTLLAVASRDEERAKRFAADTGIPRHYGSYGDLLADPDVDALYIPLPNSEHRPWSIRAAEAGKHVLCEKPLAVNAAECREMEAAARANGTLLMEAFMYRFHPRIDRLAGMAQQGAVGALRVIRSAFTFRLRSLDNIRMVPELGGGALLDVGCYCVNISRRLTGLEPLEAQAWATYAATDVDSELTGMLRFPGDVISHFDCALTSDRREMVEIAGTDASVSADAVFVPGTDAVQMLERRDGKEASHAMDGADEYQLMVEHFADCALGGTAPRWPVADAIANAAAMDALLRSARAGGAPMPVERL